MVRQSKFCHGGPVNVPKLSIAKPAPEKKRLSLAAKMKAGNKTPSQRPPTVSEIVAVLDELQNRSNAAKREIESIHTVATSLTNTLITLGVAGVDQTSDLSEECPF